MSVIEVAADLYLLVAALGLAASVQYAGLPILGQGAFVAVGGFGTLLLADHGVPLLAAVALSVLIAAVTGYLLGAGATRLYGASLALATWVLAWLVYAVLTSFPSVSGGAAGLTRSAPTELVSPSVGITVRLTPTVHLVMAAAACALVLGGLHRLGKGPAGADLAAVRESPALAASLGVRLGARRRQVLAGTAALGAFGGAGGAVLLGTVAPADVSPLLSLELLVAVLLAGSWRPWGVVLGFAVVAALPDVSDALASGLDLSAEHTRGALTSLLLVAVLAMRAPVTRWSSAVFRIDRRRSAQAIGPERDVAMFAFGVDQPLRARDVRVAFGGVRAVDGVSLELLPREVHAVIGPNGSGKSTLMRVLSGAITPDAGTVELGATTLPGNQAAHVRAGVVRTTQRTLLPNGLTTLEQVRLGATVAVRGRAAATRHLLATPRGRRLSDVQVALASSVLRAAGLDDTADRLDSGDQRLLQIARAVATGARVLLLDEPAAGMAPTERERLADLLRTLAGNGAAVCVVEHDMRFVSAVADRVTVLDQGRIVATGDPAAIRDDPVVRQVYLGADDVSVA